MGSCLTQSSFNLAKLKQQYKIFFTKSQILPKIDTFSKNEPSHFKQSAIFEKFAHGITFFKKLTNKAITHLSLDREI